MRGSTVLNFSQEVRGGWFHCIKCPLYCMVVPIAPSPRAGRQSETLLKQLEEEKSHVVQFKVDLETLKATSAADKERSEKLAQGQRDALEKEMLSKVANEKKEVSLCKILVCWTVNCLQRSKLPKKIPFLPHTSHHSPLLSHTLHTHSSLLPQTANPSHHSPHTLDTSLPSHTSHTSVPSHSFPQYPLFLPETYSRPFQALSGPKPTHSRRNTIPQVTQPFNSPLSQVYTLG